MKKKKKFFQIRNYNCLKICNNTNTQIFKKNQSINPSININQYIWSEFAVTQTYNITKTSVQDHVMIPGIRHNMFIYLLIFCLKKKLVVQTILANSSWWCTRYRAISASCFIQRLPIQKFMFWYYVLIHIKEVKTSLSGKIKEV